MRRVFFKEMIQDIASVALRFNGQPIVVNSFGRSGSTVLYKAIVKSAAKKSSGALDVAVRKVIQGTAWDLESSILRAGRVYKTHDYPPDVFHGWTPVILYVFGDVIDSVISLLRVAERNGEKWLREHCRHLRTKPVRNEELLDRDAVGLRRHFYSWYDQADYRVAFIRYETMWENVDLLSDYLGFRVELPARRERQSTTDVDPLLIQRLTNVYGDFNSELSELPDFSIANLVG